MDNFDALGNKKESLLGETEGSNPHKLSRVIFRNHVLT